MAKVFVLGGDGFCGWPTALHLAAQGYQVVIVDNLSRREIDVELQVESLTPIRSIDERLNVWNSLSDSAISFRNLDLCSQFDELTDLIKRESPTGIVHFAEQRAAPYSMRSSQEKRYTIDNNVRATHNVLAAMVEADSSAHLVHLGTMGVYGYGTAGLVIPEGYLQASFETSGGGTIKSEILFPTNPGSIYHLTKSLDQLMFAFYAKNDGLPITDLHQGIVWGTQTDETALDDRLTNRFDYDGDYGTVLNRFLIQAAIGYPLTVHGSGGQTRAFIHIRDTVRCIQLALESPPARGGRVRILNQATETHRVRDLASLVAGLTESTVAFCDNPRNEADENDLVVDSSGLRALGLVPTLLQDELLLEVQHIARRYASRVDTSKIPCTSTWTRNHRPGTPLNTR